MAELIALPPQIAKLEAGGYIAQPSGTIPITENGIYNIKPYANADVNVQPDLIDKTVTENGIYKAAEETPPVDGYRQFEVDVPDPVLEHGSATPKTTAETYTPQGDGFSDFTVEATPLETRTVPPTTQEQTIAPRFPAIGLSEVKVSAVTAQIDPDIQPENIKQGVDILGVQGTLKPSTLITKQITANGTYAAEDDNADGYSEVTVNVDTNASLDAYIQGDLTTISTNATEIADSTFYSNTTLQYINMPNVVEIGNNAFRGCSSLLLQELPINLTSIGSYAFSSCSNVSFTDIPNGVTQFLINTFYQCTSLDTIVLPQNFSLIQNNVFYGCSGLRILDLSNVEGIVTLNRTNAFDGTTCTFLFRDQAQLDAYAAATNWSTLASRFQIKGETS